LFDHRQKIAAARKASRTPINGLETANQKETRQPESWAIAFVFMLFSQASEGRHFRECESNALCWFGTSMSWMQLAPNTRQMPMILVVAVEAAEMQYDSIETSEIS